MPQSRASLTSATMRSGASVTTAENRAERVGPVGDRLRVHRDAPVDRKVPAPARLRLAARERARRGAPRRPRRRSRADRGLNVFGWLVTAPATPRRSPATMNTPSWICTASPATSMPHALDRHRDLPALQGSSILLRPRDEPLCPRPARLRESRSSRGNSPRSAPSALSAASDQHARSSRAVVEAVPLNPASAVEARPFQPTAAAIRVSGLSSSPERRDVEIAARLRGVHRNSARTPARRSPTAPWRAERRARPARPLDSSRRQASTGGRGIALPGSRQRLRAHSSACAPGCSSSASAPSSRGSADA